MTMREYSAFAPTFWTGETGKAIKRRGRNAQVLAMYLFTCPSATMYGLYYLPLPTLYHEAGFTPEEAEETLAALADLEFAYYDPAAQLVWIPTMARWQIGPELSPKDNRVRGIEKYLRAFLGHSFGREFLRLYRRRYSLSIKATAKPLARASRAPSKPETGTGSGPGAGAEPGDQEQDQRNPPTPPASAGGRGSGLRGAALEQAIDGLVAYWRRLGRFDRGTWASEPWTVPTEANLRHWRRALRHGRLTAMELRDGIANRVRQQLIDSGRMVGDERWPPTDDEGSGA